MDDSLGNININFDGRQLKPWDVTRELYDRFPPGARAKGKSEDWPKWAGSPSFAHACSGIDEGTLTEWTGDWEMSPAGFAYMAAQSRMKAARPIAFSVAQTLALIEAIEWTPLEAWEWASSLRLPFESCYLDFTDPGGECVTLGMKVHMPKGDMDLDWYVAGVLLAQTSPWPDHQADEETSINLHMLPFLRMDYRYSDGSETPHWEIPGQVLVGSPGFTPLPPKRQQMPHEKCPQSVMYGGGAFIGWNYGTDGPVKIALDPDGEGHATIPLAIMPAVPKGALDGSLGLGTREWTEEYPDDMNDRGYTERLLGLGAHEACMVALSALYFMEAVNVEVVDAPMHRRDRKRAEKRGWPIASTVRVKRTIRHGQRRSQSSNGSSGLEVQREVAGRFNHVTRGSHVRCRACAGEGGRNEVRDDTSIGWTTCSKCKGKALDPELVQPCTRRDKVTGALTCPDGCRREWVPSHWRGPVDAPAVPAVRKVA